MSLDMTSACNRPDQMIDAMIVAPDGYQEHARLDPVDPLQCLLWRYCERHQIEQESIEMIYNGHIIDPLTDSPMSLRMPKIVRIDVGLTTNNTTH